MGRQAGCQSRLDEVRCLMVSVRRGCLPRFSFIHSLTHSLTNILTSQCQDLAAELGGMRTLNALALALAATVSLPLAALLTGSESESGSGRGGDSVSASVLANAGGGGGNGSVVAASSSLSLLHLLSPTTLGRATLCALATVMIQVGVFVCVVLWYASGIVFHPSTSLPCR